MENKTKQKPAKFDWNFLCSLAADLNKLDTDPTIKVTRITIDPIDKPDPDGTHKRDLKAIVKYNKDKLPHDHRVDREHREDCLWFPPAKIK